MSLPVVHESSTSSLTVYFRDANGTLSRITGTLTYRIDCITTGAEIVDSTALLINNESSKEIVISYSSNRLQSRRSSRERRRVTVTISYGSGDEKVNQYDYWLVDEKE